MFLILTLGLFSTVTGQAPDAPENFAVAVIDSSSVRATWDNPLNSNGIILHFSLTLELFPGQGYLPRPETTSYPNLARSQFVLEITGLHPFAHYEFILTAATSSGEGNTTEASEITNEAAPSQGVRNIYASVISPNEVNLMWMPPYLQNWNGVLTNYTVDIVAVQSCQMQKPLEPFPDSPRRDFLDSSQFKTLANPTDTYGANGVQLENLTLNGLEEYQSYTLTIRVWNSQGRDPEDVMIVTVCNRTQGAAPTGSPSIQSFLITSDTTAELNWQPPPPLEQNGVIVDYSIELCSNRTGSCSRWNTGSNDTFYVLEGITPLTTYSVTVAALTIEGQGPTSAVETNMTFQGSPSSPMGVTAVSLSSNTIQVTWTIPDPANGIITAYRVTYNPTSSTEEFVTVTTGGDVTELNITGLIPYTNYTLYVEGVTVEIGDKSVDVIVMTLEDVPSEPLNLRYVNISAISIRVFWDPPAERNGVLQNYTLMHEEFGTGRMVFINIPPGNESEGVVVEPLMEYHMYSVRVAASTDEGFGPYSSPLEVLTDEHKPDAPENFTVTVIDSASVRATWEDPLDSNGIILRFSLILELFPGQGYLPQPDTTNYPSLAPSQFELIIPGLHPFARYVFILSATTSVGEGNMTDTFEITNEAVPSQGVRDIHAPVISPNEINLMWMPPELENWNGILTNYTIDIVAVQSCQMQEPLELFPDSPRREFLESSQFKTLPNPTDAYRADGVQLETLSLNGLEEYQSYTLTIRVWNSQGRDSEDDVIITVCNRTYEAAPTSSPSVQSFLITSDTTAELNWQPPPPLEQNGVIVDYSIELCSNRTGNCSRWTTGSNDTFYNLEELTPFTTYSVAVAALTSEGQGPDSPVETNMTFQGLPTMPSSLMVDGYDHNFITLSWLPPETPNGIVDLYRVTYQGFKDDGLIDEVACNITDGQMRTTPSLTINLTQLTGDSTYCIHVSARTGAGYGDISSVLQDLPNGPPPVDVIDPVTDPLVVPQPVVDPETGDDGVTDTSATVMFTLPAEIEENGPVDRVLFYVQRMPSSNTSKGTWYESSRASSEWPQYAALAVKVNLEQRRKRATEGLSVMATIGNSSVRCGPDDIICNGPLDSNAQYGVRYTLFSGDQSQEYPFFEQAQFTTENSPDNLATIGAALGGVVGTMVAVVAVTAAVVLTVYCFISARRKGSIDLNQMEELTVIQNINNETEEVTALGDTKHGNEDERVHKDMNVMQQLKSELHCKKMIFSKNDIQVSKVVGQGESGLVYCGYLDIGGGRDMVAVKTCKALSLASDKEKLLKEVTTMLSFKHPNVMSLIGVCFDGEMPLIIMPYMSNGSVLGYVKQNQKKLLLDREVEVGAARKHCLDVCHQISKGMQYLAKYKFVHRDLAARNCMIDQHGVIKVADFGLTEDMYVRNYFRRDKSEGGSQEKVPIRWMAPESIENDIYTERTDVWAFGVTCWEVFTCGGVPYAGVPAMTLLRQLRNGHRLDRPSNATCSEEIWDVMMSCWAAHPQHRPVFTSLVKKLFDLLDHDSNYIKLT